MSNEQIEKMAMVLDEAKIDARATIGSMNYGFGMWYAKALYNAVYRKQSEWISVDERLPKDCVRVLVYGETDIFIASRLNGGWFAPVHCDGEITHWMPLPEPPMM